MTLRELGREIGELVQRVLDVDLIPLARFVALIAAVLAGYVALNVGWMYAVRWWRRWKR